MSKCIFFDLDGTLTDSARGIVNSVKYAMERLQLPYCEQELYSFVGPPLHDSFCNYAGLSAQEADEAVRLYREYYAVKGIYENQPYDGILDLLQTLKERGDCLVLATSKPQGYAEEIVRHFGIAPYLSQVFGAGMQAGTCDKATIIARGMKEFTPDYMVGDRLHDIVGGKKNQIKTVGVLYGYGSEQELQTAGADIIVATVQQLKDFLLEE